MEKDETFDKCRVCGTKLIKVEDVQNPICAKCWLDENPDMRDRGYCSV